MQERYRSGYGRTYAWTDGDIDNWGALFRCSHCDRRGIGGHHEWQEERLNGPSQVKGT